MSNPDSFVDEVTDAVRRDRLFAAFRKYGWIGVVLVVLIVGGAAYNEWQKAQAADPGRRLWRCGPWRRWTRPMPPNVRPPGRDFGGWRSEGGAGAAAVAGNPDGRQGGGSLAALDALVADATQPQFTAIWPSCAGSLWPGTDQPLADRRAALQASPFRAGRSGRWPRNNWPIC